MSGRYFIDLSRLDMSIVIEALENLESCMCLLETKETIRIKVLIQLLKSKQDGQDPKIKLPYKDRQETCAMIFDNLQKQAKES